jgi:ABC-type transport system substrate-binding protein
VDEAAGPQHEAGEISDEEYDTLRRQVKVFMSEPWSTFPAFLAAYQVGYVAHPDFVDGKVEEPIGTGPFVLDEWVPDDHVTATKNEDYWRDGLPYLDEVEFRPLTDPNSRILAVDAGDIDMMITNAPTQVAELATAGVPDGQVVIEEQGAGDEQLVILNTQSGPTADLNVRKALQLATDRAAINDQLYDGYFELADAPYPKSSHWYTDPGWPDTDLAEAKKLVDEWEAEIGPLTIELTAFDNNDDLTLAQMLQAQWGEAVVDVSINTTTQNAIAEFVPLGNYNALQAPFFNGSDPDEHYPFWDPDPENIGGPGELSINFSRYTSDVTQDALHAGRQSSDVAEREAEYAKLWKDWAENVPYIFIYHQKHLLVAIDNVQGLESFTTPEDIPAATFVSGAVYMTEVWRTD